MSVKKLSKRFETEDRKEEIEIICFYDSFTGEISCVKVFVYKIHDIDTLQFINITKLCNQEPFLSIVDDIDWHEIYSQINSNDHE